MNVIIEAFQKFTDRYGLVTITGDSCGNGLLYTAEYIVALEAWKNFIPENEKKVEYARLRNVYASCQVRPGLFNRHPEHPDQEAMDDYIGCGVAAYFINPKIADDILDYGESRSWTFRDVLEDERVKIPLKKLATFLLGWIPIHYVYNNVSPDSAKNADAWLGRMPQIIAHLRMAAGRSVSPFQLFAWIVAVLSSLRAEIEDQDAFLLSWLLVLVGEQENWLCRQVSKVWRYFQRRRREGLWVADYACNDALRRWLRPCK